jgi:hypothetical protein
LEILQAAFLEEEDLDLADVLEFLWLAVERANASGQNLPLDAPFEVDEEQLSDYLAGLENDEIYNDLDQTNTQEIGQTSLISAFYNSLLFIQGRNTRLIAGAASFPINIIDCHLVNDLDIAPENSTIDHPMYVTELGIQEKMIDYLQAGGEVGMAEKDLFRAE